MREELMQLKKEVRHRREKPGHDVCPELLDKRQRSRDSSLFLLKLADVQLSLAQTEKSHFESKLKLERVAAENQALLQEKQKLQREREELGNRLRQTSEEKQQVEERWMQLHHLL